MILLAALFTEWFIFWPLLIAFVLIGGWTAEHEKYGWSAISSIAILALMYFGFPTIISLFASPIKLLTFVIGYVVIGVFWSTSKWYLKLKNTLTKFIGLRDQYIRKNKLPVGFFSTPVSEESDADVVQHHKSFARFIRDEMGKYGDAVGTTAQEARDIIQPKIWDNKSRVVTWGVYWPTSMLWFVLNDFIREIVEAIYNTVSGKLQAMSDRMFSNAL